ncbi:CoA pyrophosphatase, partial [Sodalis-like symbiont of Philaenus spumarius]
MAAVLILIICHATPTLLLTRRAASLRKHTGHVVFPGGSSDASDASAVATALREAHEEVAIDLHRVRVLGPLRPVDSSSRFQVTRIVGLLTPGGRFVASEAEVAEIGNAFKELAFVIFCHYLRFSRDYSFCALSSLP